jgi:hypothetical protein
MSYESRFERFAAAGPLGEERAVEFLRAGTLSVGDRPELYFFRVTGENEDIAVGISGGALENFERGRRCLNREEKVDVAGLMLKRQLEAGLALHSQNLFIRDAQLAELAGILGIQSKKGPKGV